MIEPRVRFRQDNGSNYPAWKEKQLGDLVTDNLDPVPTPRDGYRRVGIYCHAKGTFQEDVPAENVLDVDTMYRIHRDNLIVNITFAWEHAVAIVKPEDEGLLVSHRFPEYSFNEGQVPGFYKYLVLRPYFRNQLSLASPGGAGRNRVLNKAQFKKIPVIVPCLDEQQKIADFLSSVDDVISSSEHEVANLETQKKAVMRKIFSQEVRFKREDGNDFPAWEERSINEVSDISGGKTPSMNDASYWNNPSVNWVSSKDMKTGRISNSEMQISEKAAKSMRVYKPGTVLIVVRSGILRHSFPVAVLDEKSTINQDIKAFEVYGCDSEYFAFFLKAQEPIVIREYVKKGTTVQSIQVDDLIKMMMPLPCLEEQRLIAGFLSDFDEAIAAAKKELELWKELKKGLLQQMFV